MTFFDVVGSCISRRVVLPCPVVEPDAGPSDPPPVADEPVDEVDPAPEADDDPDDDEPDDPSEPSWAPPIGAPDSVASPATRLAARANVAN
jgi:hypothetical protein